MQFSISPSETFNVIQGYLPFDPVIRGIYFASGAVAMSVIGFVVGRKEPSVIVSSLLLLNGILIIVGIMLFAPHSIISLLSTVFLGSLLVLLGIWKIVIDRRK